MKPIGAASGRKIGRPLSFNRDAALEQAMLLFWRHGYEATAISDLTSAMGITAPSLYGAFGDKEQLFLAAVDLYQSGPVNAETIIDSAGNAREAAAGLLEASATGFTGRETPKGCLLASSTISCSAASADVQAKLAAIRRRIEARLKSKIQQDIKSGVMRPNANASALAGHVMAVIQGMSTLARDGASRDKLRQIAATAMLSWPPAATERRV